jgi:putative ABC transport system permease protein
MVILRLALRNIVGAGLRTWLNVIVLSIAFVAIIWTQGMMQGMNRQMMTALVDTIYGGGQFWHREYDPYDPLTLEDAHAPLSPQLAEYVANGQATPTLVTTGAIYPQGRIQSAQLKGIDPQQDLIRIPAEALHAPEADVIPGLIGTRMAEQTKLAVGDYVTVRWRDIHGTFDAAEIQIAAIMTTTVPSVDSGQIWLPLPALRRMLQAPNEATFVVVAKDFTPASSTDPAWVFRDLDYLLSDIRQLVRSKSVGSSVMYLLLLGMGLLAIFDTQVLSIFRRRKEMGTLMALGMTRGQVIRLFTLEGALHGLMAIILGALYGIPLLTYTARTGIGLPAEIMDSGGFAISDTLYPRYGAGLVLGTALLVLITVTIVSCWPTRRIAHLKPTDALRGKLA